MNSFGFISKYFVLLCIAAAGVNYLLAGRFGGRPANPSVDQEKRIRYLRVLWTVSVLPFLVLGFGQLVGGVPNVWAVFRPQDRNPYVWAFHGTILAIYLVNAWWVFFRDGARKVEELQLMSYHAPGKSGAVSAFWVKVISLAAFPFFAFWLWSASLMDVPAP
jgi:hypothetical protein